MINPDALVCEVGTPKAPGIESYNDILLQIFEKFAVFVNVIYMYIYN
jgi:hypothetical protein